MTTPFTSEARYRFEHYCFAHFVTECASDLAATEFVYRCFAEIYWLSLHLSDCGFPYILADDGFHSISSAWVPSHKNAGSGELSPPQISGVRVILWLVN